jgi:hypothetical protein
LRPVFGLPLPGQARGVAEVIAGQDRVIVAVECPDLIATSRSGCLVAVAEGIKFRPRRGIHQNLTIVILPQHESVRTGKGGIDCRHRAEIAEIDLGAGTEQAQTDAEFIPGRLPSILFPGQGRHALFLLRRGFLGGQHCRADGGKSEKGKGVKRTQGHGKQWWYGRVAVLERRN